MELLVQSNYISKDAFESVSAEAEQVLKMIKSAILTTKRNIATKKNTP